MAVKHSSCLAEVLVAHVNILGDDRFDPASDAIGGLASTDNSEARRCKANS